MEIYVSNSSPVPLHRQIYDALYCAVFVLLPIFTDNTAFVTGLSVLLPVSAVSAAVSADKKDDWTRYALACGLSPETAAAEKFLLALCVAAVSVALWPLAYFLRFPEAVDLSGLSVTVSLALASAALAVPLSYKLGTERGRLVLGVIMLALLASCVALLTAFGGSLSTAHPLLLALPPAACAAACVGSFFGTARLIREQISCP